MARRSKEQIRQENLVNRLCNTLMSGYKIDIMNMHANQTTTNRRLSRLRQ